MALFKVFSGTEEDLALVPYHEGYGYCIPFAYTFTDKSDKSHIGAKLFFDVKGQRHQLDAAVATGLLNSNGEYIDVDDIALNDQIHDVAHGGTGASTLAKGILIGHGTNPVTSARVDNGEIIIGDENTGISSILNKKGVLLVDENGATPHYGITPVDMGGTGASTDSGARSNLGVYSKEEVDQTISDIEEGIESAVQNIQGQINSIGESIQSIEGNISNHTQQITNLQNDVGQLTTGLTNANNSISGLANRVGSLETGQTTANDRIDQLEESIQNTSATIAIRKTLEVSAWQNGVYTLVVENLRCGKEHNVPPIVTYEDNQEEYSKIATAEANYSEESDSTIVFTLDEGATIETDIKIIVIDWQ